MWNGRTSFDADAKFTNVTLWQSGDYPKPHPIKSRIIKWLDINELYKDGWQNIGQQMVEVEVGQFVTRRLKYTDAKFDKYCETRKGFIDFGQPETRLFFRQSVGIEIPTVKRCHNEGRD